QPRSVGKEGESCWLGRERCIDEWCDLAIPKVALKKLIVKVDGGDRIVAAVRHKDYRRARCRRQAARCLSHIDHPLRACWLQLVEGSIPNEKVSVGSRSVASPFLLPIADHVDKISIVRYGDAP